MPFDLFSLSKERRDVLEKIYFNQYVDKKGPNDCWEWKAHRNRQGYGNFFKRFGKLKVAWLAHRIAWMFHYNSPIPEGLICCHSCDNPPCVNPLHIMLATHKHNSQDAALKGRLQVKAREKHLSIVQDFKNGLSNTEIMEKYKMKTIAVLNDVKQRIKKKGMTNPSFVFPS
jgi:hypothetical protein